MSLMNDIRRVNVNKITGWVLGVVLTILGFEILSIIAMRLVGFKGMVYPWSFINMVRHHYVGSILIAFLLVAGCVTCVVLVYRAGVYRWYAMIFGVMAMLCYIATYCALIIWHYWLGIGVTPTPEQLYLLFLELHQQSRGYPQLIICLTVMYGLLLAAIIYHFSQKHSKEKRVHGNAHFATPYEIHKAGFFKKDGLIVGKSWGKWLRSTGHEHALVFAPSGSGKTRSITIPNLLSWRESCVVNDVKGVLFETTSKHREQVLNNRCYLWNLCAMDGKTHRYNPFSFLPTDDILRMTEIQRIAHIIIPDGQGDAIWFQSSRELFKALVLYLMDTKDKILSFGEINRTVKRPLFDEWLKDMLDNTRHYHPEFYRNGYAYLLAHDKTRNSILKTFTGYFELFDDPLIDMATSASDFDIRNLRKEKMTIYVTFNDGDARRLSPLLTIFWEQMMSNMIKQVPKLHEEPYSVLCLIDEFSSLRRIEELRQALKLLREYRIRCVLMVQYIAQTFEKYSHDEAKAFTNIKTKIAFTQESMEDAEYISKLLGTKTQRMSSGSNQSAERGGSTTRSYNYQPVPLKRPEEIMRLKSGQAIIIRSGYAPVLAGQCIWYQEKRLKYLPCGEVDIPLQKPEVVRFEHPVNVEAKVKDNQKMLEDEIL